jgi:putative ABC transport system permease protein
MLQPPEPEAHAIIPLSYNFRSLRERRVTTGMTVGGVGLVVTTLFILLGLIHGLRYSIDRSATPGNYVLLSGGLTSEPASYIGHAQYEILRFSPEIATDGEGRPLLAGEFLRGVNVAPDRRRTQITFLRGVDPVAHEVHRRMKLVGGRWPRVGEDGWAVGERLAAKYPSLGVGTAHHYGHDDWKVVGIFSDAGSARESEVWTDFSSLATDARAQNPGSNSIHLVIKLGRAAEFDRAIANDQRLRVDLLSEHKLYADDSGLTTQLRTLAAIVAALMAIAAVFGGMNTMYSAVARRAREIGVLRVLGFTRPAVLLSFVAESAMIGLAGGIAGEVLGLAAAYATGLESRMMNVGMFIFSFRLSIGTFIAGIAASLAIGIIGGLAPAIRAARMNVSDLLREA